MQTMNTPAAKIRVKAIARLVSRLLQGSSSKFLRIESQGGQLRSKRQQITIPRQTTRQTTPNMMQGIIISEVYLSKSAVLPLTTMLCTLACEVGDWKPAQRKAPSEAAALLVVLLAAVTLNCAGQLSIVRSLQAEPCTSSATAMSKILQLIYFYYLSHAILQPAITQLTSLFPFSSHHKQLSECKPYSCLYLSVPCVCVCWLIRPLPLPQQFNCMSEYFRKFIKKQHYPVLYNEIKFKTYFTNCIQQSLAAREYHQTQDDDWNVYWCEKEFIPETLDKIRLFPEKRINHFRNYYEICRKDLLSKNVKRYKKTLEREGKAEEAAGYDYLPLTYNLPSQYPIFIEEFKRNKDQKVVWIMKPIGRSQGKGIFLFRAISEISDWSDTSNQPQAYIVQRYIHNPLLIGHKKFDMRIYVLVTSHNPLTIYLYRSGFGRFTHYRYDANDIYNNEMHLTNVAIQKQSENYDEQRGGKYLLDKLRLYILSRYGEEATDKCYFDIQELIIKTLIATCKIISNDKRCFELYGFDIMLDSNLKPWLIEINGSPSMTANTPIDRNLKNGLLDDTLTIVNIEKLLTGEEEQIGGFDLIYKNNKRIKNGVRNVSFLGCLNNRQQQIRKMAKTVALRLAQKVKQQKSKQAQKQQKKDSKNVRNKSTNVPSNHTIKSNVPTSNTTIMNKSGNSVQKTETPNQIKLPKVNTVSNSNVSHTSMKATWQGGGKKSQEGNVPTGSKQQNRK